MNNRDLKLSKVWLSAADKQRSFEVKLTRQCIEGFKARVVNAPAIGLLPNGELNIVGYDPTGIPEEDLADE